MKPTGTIQPIPSSFSSLFFFLLSFLLFIVIIEGGPFAPLTQSTTITHQAHSFDDLGEWRQIIAKGSNFIKIDLRYALPKVCIKQPRVLNFDARGCYLLSHDAPLDSQVYYTAYDIVAFVIDPTNKYLFPNTSKFYIYLDFKNNRDRYPTANLTQSDNIQKEYITFFTNTLRARNWTHVELVYNGVYLDEKGKAYPWPRTYGFGTADLNDPNSCLYTYKGQCRNKTIINNMANPLPFVDPSLSIYRMCDVAFGKFSASQYPMVYYEPTDQQTIHRLLDSYLQCGYEHKPGFSVSINIDPIQYDIYAGTRSGKAWNEQLFQDAKWAHAVPISSNGTYVSFVTLYLTQDNKIVYSFTSGALDVKTYPNTTAKNYTGGNSTFPFGAIVVGEARPLVSGFPFAASPFQKLKTFSFSSTGYYFVFVTDFRGVSAVYSAEGSYLRPVVNFTLSNDQSATVAYIGSSILKGDKVDENQQGWIEVNFIQGYASFKRVQCSFLIQWWRLRFDPSGEFLPELAPIGNPTCGVYSPLTIPVPADSASIQVAPIIHSNTSKSNDSLLCPSGSSHVGLLVVSSHKNIYGGMICINATTHTVRVCTDPTCTVSQQQLKEIDSLSLPSSLSYTSDSVPPTLSDLDVGTFPSLSFSTLPNGDIVVLEVHGDGFCYNSDWNNKKAAPTVCNIKPISSRYVLNYNYGKLQDWAKHIFEQREKKITSCDGAIYHGAYDEGSLPTAFLFLDKKNKMRMVEAHTGFPTGAIDYSGCSWPVSFDGAMIDGIILPDLAKMVGGSWEPSEEVMKLVTPNNNYEYTNDNPAGEVTLSDTICNLCKERLMKWQVKYQTDYELMQSLTLKISEMCAFGQLFVGDGTIPGCRNLLLLYLPALATDLARNIFSPDNCLLIGVCSGNASSLLPDINSQVARRSLDYTSIEEKSNNNNYNNNNANEDEEIAEFIPSDLPTNDNNNADQITKTIKNIIKAEMLKLIGL